MTELDNTQLGSLIARRQEIADKQVLKLRIPRWEEPEIVVSYRPIEPKEFAQFLKGLDDLKTPEETAEASLDKNADLLIKACLGIEAKNPDQKWQGFDDELAEALGLDRNTATARQVCRLLFVAGGDLLATATKLARWSKVVSAEIDEDFSGE